MQQQFETHHADLNNGPFTFSFMSARSLVIFTSISSLLSAKSFIFDWRILDNEIRILFNYAEIDQ